VVPLSPLLANLFGGMGEGGEGEGRKGEGRGEVGGKGGRRGKGRGRGELYYYSGTSSNCW